MYLGRFLDYQNIDLVTVHVLYTVSTLRLRPFSRNHFMIMDPVQGLLCIHQTLWCPSAKCVHRIHMHYTISSL